MVYNSSLGDADSMEDAYDFWWLEKEDDDIAAAIFAAIEQIDRNQEWQRQADIHHIRLYSNRMASGISGQDYLLQDNGERIRINVIKSAIDAGAAQNATNRPRPMFLTSGGDRTDIERAKKLNKFIAGQFYATDIYEKGIRVFIDAGIIGNGHVHVFSDGGKIRAERVFPTEIIVDEVECRDAEPRQMFRHKEVDREHLIGMYPEHEAAIRDAKIIRQDTAARTSKSDRCSVVQAWHLPSSPDADDGWTVIAVSTGVLVKRPWERDSFPILTFRLADAPIGWRGIGWAEELTPIQVEINYLAQKIQELMNLATTQIWVKKGEGVGKVDNRNMGTRTYKNTPPTAIPVRPAAMEFYQHLWMLYDKAFEIIGVSQLSAQSKKPAGLNSGEAIRTYNDIGARRFQHVGQRWERFYLQIAEAMLDEAREIEEAAKESGDTSHLKVLAAGDRDVEELKFSDVSIDRDKYMTKVWPTALLPDSPQGKIETITDLAQVSPQLSQHAVSLLTTIPDLEAVASRINAPYELVDLMIENMLDRGIYEPPMPYMDLQLAQQQTQLALMRAHKDKFPDDRLELLRRFLPQIGTMLEQAAAAALPPAPAAPPPGPMPGPDPLAGALPGAAPASIPGGPAAPMPIA